MEYLFFVILAMVVVVLLTMYLRAKRRHSAACNVVFAKYTFNKLQPEQQNSIHDKAVEMVLASTSTGLQGFANEVERYGWYALAMNALDINSAVPDNPCWSKVKNPYAAILPGDSMIYNITGALRSQYEIEVKVSADKGYDNKKQKRTGN